VTLREFIGYGALALIGAFILAFLIWTVALEAREARPPEFQQELLPELTDLRET